MKLRLAALARLRALREGRAEAELSEARLRLTEAEASREAAGREHERKRAALGGARAAALRELTQGGVAMDARAFVTLRYRAADEACERAAAEEAARVDAEAAQRGETERRAQHWRERRRERMKLEKLGELG